MTRPFRTQLVAFGMAKRSLHRRFWLIVLSASSDCEFSVVVVDDDKATGADSKFVGKPWPDDNAQVLPLDRPDPTRKWYELVTTDRERNAESQSSVD
jgi:hypothetical protein